MKYLITILCLSLLTVSCSKNKSSGKGRFLKSENDTISIIGPEEIVFDDSIVCYSDMKIKKIVYTRRLTDKIIHYIIRYSDEKKKTVVYTKDLTHNKIHYKKFDYDGTLLEIAYTKDSSYFAPLWAGHYFHLVDYVTQYRENGTLLRKGFLIYWDKQDSLAYTKATESKRHWDIYCDYDSTETLTYKHFPTYPGSSMIYIGEDYYPNGKIKERWEQGDVNAGGFPLGNTQWDSLGRKTQETTVDHRMPKGGTSYNHTFSVYTTAEYYPNGTVKRIYHEKSYTESGTCPCGEWKYYDREGNLTKTVKHDPCYNFKLDCEGI